MAFILPILVALLCKQAQSKLVQQYWVVDETLTDYYRPADQSMYSADALFTTYATGQTREALLVNDTFLGPLLEADLGDEIEITVENLSQQQTVDLHWHSMPQIGTPWSDGAYMVSGCGIPPVNGIYTYKFTAQVAGTRFWHSHVQHQMEWGLFGPLVVHDPNDPFVAFRANASEVVIMFNEWWIDPDLLPSGSPLLNNEFRLQLVNGVWGNGTDEYPYYELVVQPEKCYRLRWIAAMGEDVGYGMSIAGHSMDVIAVEGQNVQRTTVGSIAMYIGSRYDVIFCADQPPGDYLVQFEQIQREELLGVLPPIIQFGFVISYNASDGSPEGLLELNTSAPPPPPLPLLTDVNYETAASPVVLDVRTDPGAIKPLLVAALPATTHDPIVLYLGAMTSDMPPRMYSWPQLGEPNLLPHSPLLFTKATCGLDVDTRVITLPNDTVVDIVLNNLVDEVHPQHLHGGNFWVLGSGYAERPLLSNSEDPVNPVPGLCRPPNASLAPSPADNPVMGDPDAPLLQQVWGCPFDNATDFGRLNLQDPYITDTAIVPAHSWTVIRIHFANPGVWPFHCHKLYHMKAGMEMYFNIGPDVQPAIPADIPTGCGPCPAVNQSSTLMASPTGLASAYAPTPAPSSAPAQSAGEGSNNKVLGG